MRAVCILGGGYAGLRVARVLAGRLDENWSITLIDREDCHQLITRLPEVVAAKIQTHDACLPFRRVLPRRVHHERAGVRGIDLETRSITTSAGLKRPDILVIALGTAPDFLNIPGARAHSMTLKSLQEAEHLRDTLRQLRARQVVTRVVIVGAGYTGTEIAGELSAAEYRGTWPGAPGWIDVRIVAEDTRLLPQAGPRVSAAVERILRARQVPLHLGHAVRQVDDVGVRTNSGTVFEADVVVWAGQTRVNIDVHGADRNDMDLGKIAVDPYLRTGNRETVFACGDASLAFDYVGGRLAASSAQLAIQEGALVAQNVDAAVRGKPLQEFRPRVIGEALSLGGADAVAEVGGVLLSGRAAAGVKRAALLRYLAGLSFPLAG